MVDREPWSVAKDYHGRTPRLYHSQPWSTMIDNEKPWYHGQTVAGENFRKWSGNALV